MPKKDTETYHEAATLERGVITDTTKLFKIWFMEIGSSALIDDLTRLFNRRYFYHRFIQEVERTKRSKTPLSLLMLDVDNFKTVNDVHGHYRGDEILHYLAMLISDSLRKSDIVCRYGGDTFAIILPETNLAGAMTVAKRLQEKIKVHIFKGPKREFALQLTVSMGIANFPAEDKTPAKLLKRGLMSLNKAKAQGPNSISRIRDKEMVIQRGLDFDIFVGRTQEMNLLSGKLEDAASQRGGLVVISGDTGVGKTKLLVELSQKAKEWGFTVLYGKAQSSGLMSPYRPFIDGIRTYLKEQRLQNGERLEELFGVYAPQLARFFPEVSGTIGGEVKPIVPEHERQRLYEGMHHFLVNIAKERPVLLIFDDIQWATDSDLELLFYFGRAAVRERILVCCACRSDETGMFSQQFGDKLGQLRKEGGSHRIHLETLNKDESDKLVERLLNRLKFPDEVKDTVFGSANGNPMHAVEMIKSMVDEEILSSKKGEWIFEPKGDVKWLNNIGSIIERRITRLDGVTDNLLSLTSVIGESFNFDVVHKVSGINEGHLVEIFDRVMQARLICEAPGSVSTNFIFAHNFIQDKFYERLSESRRRHMHAQIAVGYEKVYADRLNEVYGELGWHYAESGDSTRALEYSLKAAKNMQDVFAHQEAIGYYRMAAKICEKYGVGSAEQKAAIFEGPGDIYATMGELGQALENYQMLVDAGAPDLGHKYKTEVWTKIGRMHLRKGEYNEAVGAFNLARSFADQAAEPDQVARIDVAMAGVLYQKSQFDEALSLIKEIIDKGDSAKRYIGEAYLISGAIYMKLGNDEKAMENYEQAMVVWDKLGDIHNIAHTQNNIGSIWLMRGDDDGALKYFEASLELYERIGDILHKSAIMNNIGLIHNNRCEWNKGLDYFMQGLAITTRLNNRHLTSYFLSNIGVTQLKKGNLEEALEHLKRAMVLGEEFGDTYVLCEVYTNLSRCYLYQGNHKTALEYNRQAKSLCEIQNLTQAPLENIQVMAEIYLDQDKIDQAKQIIEGALVEAEKLHHRLVEILILITLGHTYLRSGDAARAVDTAERALRMAEGLKNQHLYGKALFVKALGLESLGQKKEMQKLLNETQQIFEKIGAMFDLKKVKEELKKK